MAEYTPSEDDARDSYITGMIRDGYGADWDEYREGAGADFDAFLARVRRDAVRQFIEACKEKRDEPGFLLPANYWQDIDAAIRVAESYIKNYPETED